MAKILCYSAATILGVFGAFLVLGDNVQPRPFFSAQSGAWLYGFLLAYGVSGLTNLAPKEGS
jgi:hypothetical protein